MRDRSVVRVLGDAVDEMFLLGIAADIGEGQHDEGKARGAGFFLLGRCRSCRGRLADFKRIDVHRLGDVLELG